MGSTDPERGGKVQARELLCAAELLRQATKQLRFLRCIRGTSKRTLRHATKIGAAVVLALQLFSAAEPPAASAQCTPHFVNTAGFPDTGYYSTPAFADIDGDGDFDAFIGDEAPNYTWIFENTGSPRDAEFDFGRWDPFELNEYLPLAFITLGDIDGDGDLDAFVGNTDGLSFSENIGSPNSPLFVRRPDNPFGFELPGFSTLTPELADLDGDADLDLLVADGNALTFVENVGTPSSPSFTDGVAGAFGLGDAAAYAKPRVVDIDGDRDLDVFTGEGYDILFFENVGTRKQPRFAAPVADPFGLHSAPDADASPAFVDIDGDGDFDAFVGSHDGTHFFFENIGTATAPAFRSMVQPFGITPLDTDGYAALPAFADMDGDGDVDSWLNDETVGLPRMVFRRNVGTPGNPSFAPPVIDAFGLTGAPSGEPVFADLDGDGDLDAFVRGSFAQNTGTSTVPAFGPMGLNPFGLPVTETPSFVDIDADGDLDAFTGISPATFFENTGSPISPSFSPGISNPFGISNTNALLPASPDFIDVDGDGDLDLIANGTHYIDQIDSYGDPYSTYRQSFELMENVGTPTDPAFTAPIANPFGLRDEAHYVRIAFADLDGDGRVDAFVGIEETGSGPIGPRTFPGGLQFYRNDADCAARCPEQPLASCAASSRASLNLRSPDDPAKNRLIWNWKKGTALKSDFGNPAIGTSLLLCVYDDGELEQTTLIESAGDCGGAACWKQGKSGYSRKNPDGADDGVTKLRLSSGNGKAKIQLTGKGSLLDLPALPMSQFAEVKVQLIKTRESSQQCWESTFDVPAQANDDEKFKDRTP